MPDASPTLVIAIDGLRASALGAYGQTAYETPTLDALAAESVTHEWCYAPTPEPRDLYERLARRLPPGAVVLTGDPTATAPLVEAGATEVVLPVASPDSVAGSIAETACAETLAAVAEQLVACIEESGSAPPLLWIHSRGLYGPWDAPAELHESLVDEGDPEVIAGPAAPDAAFGDADSTAACDARFAASCRYAGQVMALDACLAALFDLVDGLFEGQPHRLVVAGLRGFPLGEHGRVGGVDPRLFSEQQQVPLLVRDGDPATRFTRIAGPHTLSAALTALLAGGPLITGRADLCSAEASAAITLDRMLRLDRGAGAAAELYVKPDDRWEQNDIVTLEEETAAEMLAGLAGDSGVAANDAGL